MQREAARLEPLVVGMELTSDCVIASRLDFVLDGCRHRGRPILLRNRDDEATAPFEGYSGRLRVDLIRPATPAESGPGICCRLVHFESRIGAENIARVIPVVGHGGMRSACRAGNRTTGRRTHRG